MDLSNDLQVIVARAANLDERRMYAAMQDGSNALAADGLLKRWQERVAHDNPLRFDQRLALDGLDQTTALHVLAATPSAEPLPTWSHTLGEALGIATVLARNPREADLDRCQDAEDPLPFEHVLLPFVILARRRLARMAGAGYDRLTEAAHAACERYLLERLVNVAGQVLELEFSLFRVRTQGGFAQFLRKATDDPRRHYTSFVTNLLDNGLATLFREYSALARLLATLTEMWLDATAAFLVRLEADAEAIEQIFGAPCDQICELRPGLSDPHRGGQTVIALTCTSGLRLIYKPKSLTLEAAFGELLAWLNERCTPEEPLPTMHAPVVLDQGTYGWMAYVQAAPCATPDAARRFYMRCGVLLCLMHLLDGTDLHHENLIAAGEHPVLVDLEALMHPRLRPRGVASPQNAQKVALARLYDSVLRVGLLPSWDWDADNRAHDVSGFGAADDHETDHRIPQWLHINTDRMVLRFERMTLGGRDHLPALDGATLAPDGYAEEIAQGFRSCYQLLACHRAALLAPDSPLERFAGREVRVILRDTKTYGNLLLRLTNPRFLRSGIERSLEFEVLAKGVLRPTGEAPLWLVYRGERAALEWLDIPLFTTRTDGCDLSLDSAGIIPNCLVEAGDARVRRRVAQLDESDLAMQLDIIRGSLYSYAARLPSARRSWGNVAVAKPVSADTEALIDPLATASALAQELERRAVRATDGSVTWIGLAFVPDTDRFQFQPLGDELYNGTCGVALFFAALGHISDDERWRELALAAVRPLMSRLADSVRGAGLAQLYGIGGASGVGSLAYGLHTAGRLLGESTLVEAALEAALLITPERISADRRYDVMEGAAGALLVLLTLHRHAPQPELLDRARLCGEHLLTMRVADPSGLRAWPDEAGQLLTGFSHGAAGIAYALLRLYEATGDEVFHAAAAEGIAYEQSVFDAAAGNWPDLRATTLSNDSASSEPWFMSSWCHGAPGIGLARLGGLGALDTPAVRAEIAVAIDTTLHTPADELHHLCCGNAGRAEILLEAGLRLDRSELIIAARALLAITLRQAGPAYQFRLFANLPAGAHNVGFFAGVAGIGYALLRLHQPRLPAVLLWE